MNKKRRSPTPTQKWLLRAKGINERINALQEAGEDDESIKELKQIQSEVLAVIAQVQDHVLATLLIERYVNAKKWDEIAEAIHYSFSHTEKTLHKKALKEVAGILEALQ